MTKFLSYTLCALSLLLPIKAQADVQPNTSQTIDLPVKDVIYDASKTKLYVSVGAEGGARANTVTTIDPLSGQIVGSIAVGASPGHLALAPGGTSLYVATDNAKSVTRLNTSSGKVINKWWLGSSQYGGPLLVQDMEVMPGNDEVVAISLAHTGVSPQHAGVAIYDNGVKRPTQTPGHTGSNVIEFINASTLWGYTNESSGFGLRRLSVDASGVTEIEERSVFYGFGNDIRYASGRLFDASGQIASIEGVLQGSIPNVTGLPVVRGGRVFYCANDLLSAFDLDTQRLAGTLSVNSGSDLVAWGTDGFAWRRESDDKLVIARSELVNAPSPTPGPLPSPRTLRQGLRVWDVPANELIWDETRRRLLVSTPSTSADGNGNSILPLDPVTGRGEVPIYVGSDPRQMALSDDGKTLYVALEGSGEIRRVDLSTTQAGLRWSLGSSWLGGSLFTDDLEAVPGFPDRVVVARRNARYSPRHDGVALYENGVQTGTATAPHTGSNVIEFGDGGTLWGGNNESTDFGLRKMSVTSSGVAQQSVVRNAFGRFGFDFAFAAGKIYATNGAVIDPNTGATVGTFSGGVVCPDVASNRLFVLKADIFDPAPRSILVYDLTSLQLVGTIALPEITGNALSLVRWGDNGLAFRTVPDFYTGGTASIVLVEDALVAPSQFLGLSLRSTVLKEKAGARATIGTVARSANFSVPLEVNLRSNLPSLLVPNTVTIPAGAKSATFYVGVADDALVTGTQNVTLSALASNYRSAQKNLRIYDDEAVLRLNVTPGVFSENVGLHGALATISRGAALDTPLQVHLASNRTDVVRLPSTVTIPAGASQVKFYLDVLNNSLVDGSKTVILAAGAPEWVTSIGRVLVTDDDRPTTTRVPSTNPSAPSS